MSLTFSPLAQSALDIMNEGKKNMFLTGKAGTGKSTLLEYFRENAKQKVVVLAPTGVSAINVKGETIHSFFGLKPGFELPEAKKKSLKPKNPSLYKRIQTLVIDEVSMVRADLMDAMDIFLRNARKNPDPFGGVQIICIGDLYQLPPVLTNDDKKVFYEDYGYTAPYFFESDVFKRTDFAYRFIELDHIYRQKDAAFIDLLNCVRDDTITQHQINELNKQEDTKFFPKKDSGFISLCTTNNDANIINWGNLEEIETDEFEFDATISGEIQKNQYPAETNLFLKEGSQIIFLNNDAERKWVNGSIGHVHKIDKDNAEMSVIIDGRLVTVEPHTWEISKYVINDGELNRETLGSFTQFPVRLAWAITIHKSQGKTFDSVIVDLGRGTFAHGQAYTALSRCTSFEGMILRRKIRKSDIKMDRVVQRFLAKLCFSSHIKVKTQEQKKTDIQKAIEGNYPIRIFYASASGIACVFQVIPKNIFMFTHQKKEYFGVEGYDMHENTDGKWSFIRILEVE